MPPIRSINEPRGSEYVRTVGPGAPGEQPKIFTSAVAEPPKPTATYFTPERIVGMVLFYDQLYVATENGVYVHSEPGIFKRLKFEIVEEQNED